jgi:D-alanyl-D-alanine carboxypeptidase/D-alanyl-D-alanine-endopeptidase (penicillin-binding protein 4)
MKVVSACHVARVPALVVTSMAMSVLLSLPASGVDAAPHAETAIVEPAATGAPWSVAGVTKLDADLDRLLAAAPGLRGAHVGVLAVETATGNVLYERRADEAFQPASTLKLLVGSVALERLTPAFVWTTSAALDATPTPSNAPDVVLIASGDPTLATRDLDDAVSTLPVGNIGTVLIDDSAFDDEPYAPGWTWDDFGEDYAPSISAATLDENVIDVRVTPGPAPGTRASVVFADGRSNDPMQSAPCDAVGSVGVRVVSEVTTGTPGSDDTVDATQTLGRCPRVIGSIPVGAAPETIAVSMFRPIANMHEAFSRALVAKKIPETKLVISADGLQVDPIRRNGSASHEVPFWTHRSKPLSALLGPRFWIPSDNLFGELLLKELGLRASGKPGTTESGIADEKAWLASIGVDPATVTLADGCGMSQYDRITPRDLVAILQHDWNGPNRQLVLDSLPVGGARGTIEGIAGTPAAGRVFAKTGSMMHVRGLAGYLGTERHGAVSFAFEVDDWIGDYPALAAARAAVLSRIIRD